MPSSGEPLELQLQRERVARVQVEAALELARLQLIEMEHALRKVRADATACLIGEKAQEPVTSAKPSPMEAVKPPAVEPSAEVSAKPRVRRVGTKSSSASLVDVARAAESIEKYTRQQNDRKPVATAMSGMSVSHHAQPIVSTLDLYVDDHRAIVEDFVAHLQTRMSKMQACYGAGSLTELKWHVNWISLNASRAGFAPLTDPAKQLEEVIEQQLNGQIPGLLDAVIQLGERVSLEPARR